MNKILYFLTIMLLISAEATASLRMTSYRWRNDDGNETTATWRAAQSAPITISNTTDPLRLRIAMDNDNGAGYEEYPDGWLQYSSDNGATWTTITNAPTDEFVYHTSANVTHNAATTNQLTGTAGTWKAGKIINNLPNAGSETIVYDGEFTEYEWVLKATDNTKSNATYIFQTEYWEDLPITYPTLNTTCLNAVISSTTSGSSCGPGTINLSATAPNGTIISWRDSANNELFRGPAFTTPVLTATTTYYAVPVRPYGNNQECFGPRVTVTASIYPVPTVTLGNDTAFCAGNVYNLKAVPGNYPSYSWNVGGITNNININSSGLYKVTITDNNNCTASDEVEVTVHPLPTVMLPPDTAICKGDTVTLNADPLNEGNSILWNTGSISPEIKVYDAGTYTAQATNQWNCISTDKFVLNFKDTPHLEGINAFYQFGNTYIFTLLNPRYYTSAEWDFGDNSPRRTGNQVSHTYNTSGLYDVTVTLSPECPNGDPATFRHRLDALSVKEADIDNKISLYPNPAQQYLMVTSELLDIETVVLYDITGRKMDMVPVEHNGKSIKIDVSQLPSSLYTLYIVTPQGSVQKKVQVIK